MKSFVVHALAVCALLAVSCHALDRTLMLVGGELDDYNSEIYTAMINGAGGPSGTMCVIAAAGADPCCDPDSSWALYKEVFARWGAKNVVFLPIEVDKKNNSFNQTIVNQIRQCTGWFFGGGDQRRVTDSLFYNDTNGARQPTPALIALWETFNINGGMIGGSSAGTSCQPTNPMITDGTSYYGILKGAIVDGTIPNDDDNYLTFDSAGGIGVFPYGLLDTHFADRGRQGRFMMLALASRDLGNASIGYGMDQNTAISVNLNSKTATVVGTQGVTICQSKDAKWAKGEPYTTVYNMRCSYATPYDKIDLTTGKISFASYKTPLVGREGPDHAMASNDIFNSPDNPNGGQVAIKQFVLAATSLFNSTDNQSLSYTWETQPMRFGITMTKDAQSVGYEGTVVGISFTSYQDLRVDITPMP